MHELALANQIVDIVVQAGKDYGAEKILSASVVVGRLMAVEVDNLQFALNALKDQFSATSTTDFIITEEPVQVVCGKCGSTTQLEDWVFVCAVCGANDVKVVAGDSMMVLDIDIADD